MFSTLLRDLRSQAINNIEFYQNGTTRTASLFYKSFSLLHEHLDRGIQPSIEEIIPKVSSYDLSPDIQANGYRSMIKVVYKCCQRLLQISRHISNNRKSMFFRSHHYSKELESHVAVLGQLRAGLHYAAKLMPFCDEGSLFANEEYLDNEVAENLLKEVESLSQDCFYGRSLGFQFCDSMVKPLQGVAVAMASFSEGYKNPSQFAQLTSSLINFGKYYLDPDLRAQRLSHLACPQLHVNEVITLKPSPFEMNCQNSVETVIITPPCAHTGPADIKMRLLSNQWRKGQRVPKTKMNDKPHQMSPGLVLHCHGGGFVAQSSRSHEVYLRHWAKILDVPILSIDYSLAPDLPFPRALEECFYAYAWALENAEELGWTGEKICFAGDSAGGNLVVATAIRAASFQIRVPDGIMAAYTPFLVRYTPSPSRLMGLMDPLLPVGILTRCLAAYAGVSTSFSKKDEKWVVIEYKKSEYPPPPDSVPIEKEDNSAMDNLTSSSEMGSSKDEDSLFEEVAISNSEETKVEHVTVSKEEMKSDEEFEVVTVAKGVMEDSDSTGSQFTLEDYNPEDVDGAPENSTLKSAEEESGAPFDGETDFKGVEGGNGTPVQRETSEESAVLDVDQGASSNVNMSKEKFMDENLGSSSLQFSPESDNVKKHKKLARVSKGISSHKSFELPPGMCKSVTESEGLSGTKSKSMTKQMSMSCISERGTNDDGEFDFFQKSAGTLNFVPIKAAKEHIEHSPLTAFRHLPIVKNPYMSPLLATDELLKNLPPVYLVACHLDPLLDDSVMFAKKLRDLNKTVDLHLIDDLPHGFLNFSLVSKEARLASDICISKIMAVLG